MFQEPREIIAAACGVQPLEMPLPGLNSFCCGAGDGRRMWMDEDFGQATYLARSRESLALQPSVISVACPYCMTMFEDGLRDENTTDKVKVKDVAELVIEAML